ncbi:hypothetical protein BCR34DRAFT_588579 [Clohesyomyces aquaticus]|uniref:Uncharacterized protein n=1 Tax=Clohesyomyces aquaticus TaxID=1231657 RepID=A0A1Y1ZJS4_9PLEO|nr:hypothetical protein BCR34DRAFT_588579 [Clohesyomyces aquaticus]
MDDFVQADIKEGVREETVDLDEDYESGPPTPTAQPSFPLLTPYDPVSHVLLPAPTPVPAVAFAMTSLPTCINANANANAPPPSPHFSQYVNFIPLPSAPLGVEFQRLASSQALKPGTQVDR